MLFTYKRSKCTFCSDSKNINPLPLADGPGYVMLSRMHGDIIPNGNGCTLETSRLHTRSIDTVQKTFCDKILLGVRLDCLVYLGGLPVVSLSIYLLIYFPLS